MCPWKKPIRLLFALSGALTKAACLLAQAGETSAMPVEVRADPEVTGPEKPVRLLGTTPMVSGIEM